MKTLSIRQPWASLILNGIKDIENRSRRTNFRGTILVHSSSNADSDDMTKYLTKEQMDVFNGKAREIGENQLMRSMRRGCILGSVEIYDCVKNDPSVWAEKGVWNWKVRNARLFHNPIPAKGMLGLWNFNGDINELNKEQ